MLDTEADDGQPAVDETNGREAQPVHGDRLTRGNAAGAQRGDKRVVDVGVAVEDVLVYAAEVLHGVLFGEHLDG